MGFTKLLKTRAQTNRPTQMKTLTDRTRPQRWYLMTRAKRACMRPPLLWIPPSLQDKREKSIGKRIFKNSKPNLKRVPLWSLTRDKLSKILKKRRRRLSCQWRAELWPRTRNLISLQQLKRPTRLVTRNLLRQRSAPASSKIRKLSNLISFSWEPASEQWTSTTSPNTKVISTPNLSLPSRIWPWSQETEWTRSLQGLWLKLTDRFWAIWTKNRPVCWFRAWWLSCMPIDTTRTTFSWCRPDRKIILILPSWETACTTTARRLKTGSLSTRLRPTFSLSLRNRKAGRSSLMTRKTCQQKTSRNFSSTRMTSKNYPSIVFKRQLTTVATLWLPSCSQT